MVGANTTVSIYHLGDSGSTSVYPGTADVTGVEAYIESQKGELTAVLGQNMNMEVFLMHCDPVSIAVGDKVVDASSVEYRVNGIERHENNPDTEDVYIVTMHRNSL